MKIRVNDRYTYDCPFKVKVGDRVKLPSPRDPEKHWTGIVTAVNDDGGYKGPCKKVLAKEEEDLHE